MIADDRGILGLPVKLAVGMLVIATMTPVIMGMVGYAEDSMSVSSAEAEGRKVLDGISRASSDGVGCSVTVTVSLASGESLEMGGDSPYVVRLLDDGEVKGRMYIQHPALPVLGETVAVSGEAVLTITYVVEDGIQGIRVAA